MNFLTLFSFFSLSSHFSRGRNPSPVLQTSLNAGQVFLIPSPNEKFIQGHSLAIALILLIWQDL